jgi:hypothetical protein
LNQATARGASANTIELDAAASDVTGAYLQMTVAILQSGTLSATYNEATPLDFLFTSKGSGQSKTITAYDGPTRTAIVNTDWSVIPDDTSFYQIINTVNQGQAQSATITTIMLSASASSDNGAYNGLSIQITTGTGENQSNVIVGYDGVSKVATVASGWETIPDNTSTYTITEVLNQATARGASANTIELDAAASDVTGAYLQMTVAIIDDPDANIKRGDVKMELLEVRNNIAHTAGIVESAWILQEGNAMQGMSEFLDTTPDRLAVLTPFATEANGLTDYLDALLTPIAGGQVPDDLPPFIESLSRTLVLFDNLAFSVQEIEAVISTPQAFNVNDPNNFTFDNIEFLSDFKQLVYAFNDQSDSLIAYFKMPNDVDCPGAKILHLAALAHWAPEQICQLINLFWPANEGKSEYDYTTVAGVFRLEKSFDISYRTGLDINSLLQLYGLNDLPLVDGNDKIIAANWNTYMNLAAMVLGAVNAKFGDSEFAAIDNEITSYLNEQKRDALLGYTIWLLAQTYPAINNSAALYQYLLIDVEMSGCDSLSYIAQAIASVQLYMHRCRMMLEPGVTDLSNIPEVWWEWMSTYRIWEANRKIFLYPENYIEPALRSDQTPQFQEFVESLLQTDINEKSVSEAYQQYFTGFSTVANLVNCGSFSSRIPQPGTKVTYASGTAQSATTNTLTLASNASLYYNEYKGMLITITAGTGAGQKRSIITYKSGIATVSSNWSTVPDNTSTYVITGPEVSDTLFIIGRTNTQPFTYYYRTFSNLYAWTAWKEIQLPISSALVSPVYAFSKLFLFWTEINTVGSSLIESQSGNSLDVTQTTISDTTSTVKYSFLDTDDTWIAPQVVAEDVVVNYSLNYELDPKVLLYLPGTEPAFNPENIYWQKVYPLHVPSAKITVPNTYPNGENIFLYYSFGLVFSQNKQLPSPSAPLTNMPPDQYQLQYNAYDLGVRFNQMGAATIQPATGYLPLEQSAYIDGALTASSLNVALINYLQLLAPQPYYPLLNRGQHLLGMNNSTSWNTIIDNYYSDDYAQIPLGTSSTPNLSLLSNISGGTANLITVKNLPGSFIFDNGDEAFLVTPSDNGIQPISNVLLAASVNPPFPAGNFYFQLQPFTTTDPAPPLNTLRFAFVRLSTSVIGTLNQRLILGGIPYLLTIESQMTPELPFSRLSPNLSNVIPPPSEKLDFNGAYGLYFWEIFFFAPFLVADSLKANQRYREAKIWYEYIYNPTQQPSTEEPISSERYWRFLPFKTMNIPTLTQILTNPAQIKIYNDHPFDPDAIARLRTSAYAKAIVMKYIDNLIDWGDLLFTQDTRESITQATNLYVMAGNLLGKRPEAVGECPTPEPMSFNEIKEEYNDKTIATGTAQAGGPLSITLASTASSDNDEYTGMYISITGGAGNGQQNYIIAYDGKTRVATVEKPWDVVPDNTSQYRIYLNGIPQFLIRLENTPFMTQMLELGVTYSDVPFNDINSYFCVPENTELIAYWDTIEDRLYKIRHCMNIQGQVRSLALFEPPINPRELIQASRAGASSLSLVPQLSAPIPNYRFSSILDRAYALTSAVIQLGVSLLSALEKKDAEALALLRVTQEKTLLDMTTYIKEQQIEQQNQMKLSLEESLKNAQTRYKYYTEQIDKGLSAGEIVNIAAMTVATIFNYLANAVKTASAIGYAVPQAGSPFAMTYGGEQIGAVLNATAGALEGYGILANYAAQMSLTIAGYQRRESEWGLQKDLAGYDEQQINYQIAATDIAINIANRELQIHTTTIKQNQEMATFLKDKFTNEKLYLWMVARLSAVYFQTYSLALELARSAQRAYQYEMNTDQSFVNFTYWDSLRKGLLAGEGLMLALNQMEKVYIDTNSRSLEIEKTISLLQLNPIAMLSLVENGECIFELSERLFDDDFPGQYARKIKTVSITIPSILGPYQNIHAMLTQLSNQTIIKPDVNAVNFLLGGSHSTLPGPEVLRSNWWVNQQIALSKGTADTGMFELNFNDNRYLPFEGTGAVSSWRLSLPKAANRINYSNISDVIIQIKYTALDGGSKFKKDVMSLDAMKTYYSSDFFLMAQVFSSQWYTFLNQPSNPVTQKLEFVLADLVPPQIKNPLLTGFYFQLIVPDGTKTIGSTSYIRLKLTNEVDITFNLARNGSYMSTFQVKPDMSDIEGNGSISFTLADTPSSLKLKTVPAYLDPAVIQNIVLILFYEGEIQWR